MPIFVDLYAQIQLRSLASVVYFALLSVGRDLKFANNILSRRKEQEEEEVRGSEEEEEEIEIADGQR